MKDSASVSTLANASLEKSHQETIKKITRDIEEFNKKDILKLEYKRSVLVVGNSGTGKSTLINFLAGDDLVVNKVKGNFIIKNNQSGLEIGHTSRSQTFFPEFRDISGTPYCDMPGFQDTRGVAEDIAKAVFMKKVADYVNEVKIVIAITHSHISHITDSRFEGLRSLLKHLSNFIHNIDSFNNGISIVVTKVENRYELLRGVPIFKTDDEIIKDISLSLETFIEQNRNDTNKFLFLQSIIDQKRISIFRTPLEEGTLKDLQIVNLGKVFENEQKSIQDAINKTSYLSKDEVDFGYSVTSDSQIDSIGIARELKAVMAVDIGAIFKEIEKHYLNEVNNSTDIYELKNRLDTQNWNKKEFDFSNPISFLTGVRQKVNKFIIPVTEAKFKEFLAKNEFLAFLQSLSQEIDKYDNYQALIDKYDNYQALDDLLEFLNKEKEFNQKLIDLVDIKLTDESVIQSLDKLKNNRNDEGAISTLVNGFRDLTEIQKSQIKKLLDFLLKSPEAKNNGNIGVVVGHIVKLSEVIKLINVDKVTSLCIYSSKAIIMDNQALTLNSKNLSIIAPEWYMFGSTKITLDGLNADAHDEPKAGNGKTYGDKGTDGLPGKPGYSAGNFLGVGNTVNYPTGLTISSKGGNGGDGQHGGDGSKGKDGLNAKVYTKKIYTERPEGEVVELLSSSTSKLEVNYQERSRKEKYKNKGGDGNVGGKGGTGGQGGLGGKKGTLEIFNIKMEGIFVNSQDGDKGNSGQDGQAGRVGQAGQDAYAIVTTKTYSYPELHQEFNNYFVNPIDQGQDNRNAKDGETPSSLGSTEPDQGQDNRNAKDGETPSSPGSTEPNQAQKIEIIWYQPFVEYKKFMTENSGNKFLKHNTEEFFGTLNEIQGKIKP